MRRVRKDALERHSSHSFAAREGYVRPLPIPITPSRPQRTAVRMATLNWEWLAPRYPIAPVYTPRGVDSSWAMRRMAWILGAPVTEPEGKRARTVSEKLVLGRRSASMVEVICHTVG